MAVVEVLAHQQTRREVARKKPLFAIPPLENDDHLTRAEFERRYEAMPYVNKAELIEGRVYMPSAVRRSHRKSHADVIGWLVTYAVGTPGVEVNDNGTVRLDDENEPQPDALLRITIPTEGHSSLSSDDYVEGAPELVVEVAGSSASIGVYEKFDVYQRRGVREYVVWQIYENRLDWFMLRDKQYVALQPDAEGILHSQTFPGLQLAVDALLAGDMAEVLSAQQQGLQQEKHQAFVRYLHPDK